jgi:hypothetical protein
VKIDFDPSWLNNNHACFTIDASSFKILKKDDETTKCPLTNAVFLKTEIGKICPICNLCEIGAECLGLTLI